MGNCLPVNRSTATKEPGLPMRTQAEEVLRPCSCGTEHCTSAPSWAAGLSQSTLPLAPDRAATKVQGEEKPGGERPSSGGHGSPSSPHPVPGPSPGPYCWPHGVRSCVGARVLGPWPAPRLFVVLLGRKGNMPVSRNSTNCFPHRRHRERVPPPTEVPPFSGKSKITFVGAG